MSNITRTSLDALSQANFPNNTTQQISPADLRDWIESAVDSFVTQKDTSTFENAFYECKSSNITAVSGTTNLALATGNFVHITGSGSISITSFGTLPAGSRFILNFETAVTLVYNATQMILPGASNIVTAAGDSVMVVSEGSGNWRLIGYFPGSGLPVGTVTAVTASSPLSATPGNAPNISIPQATGSVDGYLDHNDFATFSGKQDALTAGSGISIISNTVSNTAPDQTVSIGSGTGINVTGTYPNFTIAATGTGGTPGGADGQIQYNNGLTAFGGVSDLNWDDVNNVLTINTPRIGQSNGNGHMHIHSANSAPSGITDYLTMFWQKATRVLGFRSETDTHETYLQFTAPTADRTYTFPDASGNVVLDTNSQTLSNKTLSTPTIDGIATFGNGTSAGEIRLLEGSAGGSNYTALKAAATLASNYSLTLPVTSPGTGQALVSDSSGNLSWSSNPGTTGAKFIRTTSVASVTGTTAETLLNQLLIPANTFSTGDGMNIIFRATRTNTSTTIFWRFYISDVSGTFSGKPQMSNVNLPNNTALGLQAQRNVFISSATSTYFNYAGPTVTRSTDFGNDNFTVSNIDWTIDQYLIMTCQIGNTTGTSTSVGISVSPT